MHLRNVLSLIVSSVMLIACTPASGPVDDTPTPTGPVAVQPLQSCTLPPAPTGTSVAFKLDVPYDSAGGVAISMDLAWPTAPAPRGTRPLIVMVHGGAWREGSPHQYIAEAMRLAGQGYVVASAGYRLVPQVRFPVPIGDVMCAIRFLRLASLELGGDSSRVMLIGHSAGAHIVALAGLRPEGDFDAACPYRTLASNRVSGVVALSGVYDLTRSGDFSTSTRQEITNLLGGPAESRPDIARSASPVFHVSAGDPHVLLIHGDADDVAPFRQSEQLFNALQQGNVPSTLMKLNGVWHDVTPLDTTLARRSSSCTVWSFIQKRIGTAGS
ncbi:MAG: alpha/beta hydrolase fold domain-containing protein [Gemmatimonas sp.]